MSFLLRFRFNPHLHGRKTKARAGVCSWHGGDCRKKPRWSFYTPTGWQSACRDAKPSIEDRYGSPVNVMA
ncbi:hypothetical protein [Streptomyces pseudogriseolus]|uniref:hypothetical protein n=1 Tax=Streptomyces pseudogriseolus TaxID=36817 RepID=UPI003FA322B4